MWSWLLRFAAQVTALPRSSNYRASVRVSVRPIVECLEPRLVLASLTGDSYSQVQPQWFDVAHKGTASELVAQPIGSLTTATGSAQSMIGPIENASNRWIVRINEESLIGVNTPRQVERLLGDEEVRLRVIHGLGLPGMMLVDSGSIYAEDVRASLLNNEHVAYFERDSAIVVQDVVPNDPDLPRQWWVDSDLGAQQAWEITTGNSDVVVAVIDTGIDYTHADLATNIWVNPGEVPGNGIDDDENGFIDDIHGYDFFNDDGDPIDDHGHGTHVAGIIGASGNDGLGIAGINWSSSLMAVKFLSRNRTGSSSDAVRAINYATMMRTKYGINVRISNNSWGARGDFNQAVRDAIAASQIADMLFVAAAGNGNVLNRGIDNDTDRSPFYPASYDLDNIISVAAVDLNDQLAQFSNFGEQTVDLAAPGVGIYSTGLSDSYRTRNGTSMAAPFVTGVAALIFSTAPRASAEEVKRSILHGSVSIHAKNFLLPVD